MGSFIVGAKDQELPLEQPISNFSLPTLASFSPLSENFSY
jgi:hypothetical protein